MTTRFGTKALTLTLAMLSSIFPSTALGTTLTPVIYDDWTSGNAANECAQIGNYTYALKIAEGRGEGAPNGSETYTAKDPDTHTNTITISNSDGNTFNWSANPNSIGAVIVKAGKGANVWVYDPQVKSDTGLYGYANKGISHVTFCWNLDKQPPVAQWCSPGYWRQPQHLASWAATGISPNDLFFNTLGYSPSLSKKGVADNANPNPSLLQVLQSPQWYGGDAFNAVGDRLSQAHPDVNYIGVRVEDSCPLK